MKDTIQDKGQTMTGKQHKFEILSTNGKHIDFIWNRRMLKIRTIGETRLESDMFFETVILKRLS